MKLLLFFFRCTSFENVEFVGQKSIKSVSSFYAVAAEGRPVFL